MAWLDTDTQTSLPEAANYIATIEHRQGFKLACFEEEVALYMGFIDPPQVEWLIGDLPKGEYRSYLELVYHEGANSCPQAAIVGGTNCRRHRALL